MRKSPMYLNDAGTSKLEMIPIESQPRESLNISGKDENVLNEAYIISTAGTVSIASPFAGIKVEEKSSDPKAKDQIFLIEMNESKSISNQTNTAQRKDKLFKTSMELKLVSTGDTQSSDDDEQIIPKAENEVINSTEPKEEICNKKDVNLGFIQMGMSKMCYVSDNMAITITILIAIATNLLDGFGDVGLSASLFWNGDIVGATILLSIDYLAVVLTVIHFSMTTASLNISWNVRVLECTLLIILHPIAPSITMIFWLVARYKHNANMSDHFHFLTKLVYTITATFEASLQVISTTCLSLTGRIKTPWNNNQEFCDGLGNCLPMGYFTIFVYCLSWLAIIKASIEAFQVGNKVTLAVFILTTLLFRISCFIALATYSTYWSLLILIPLLFTNLLIVSRCSHESQTGVHILTSVFCSIFVTTVIPEDPSKKEKTGESTINQNLAVYMATLMSLFNIPIIFLGTTIVFLFVEYSSSFIVDPCIEIDSFQLRFLFFHLSIPLFILSMMATIWFYITQTETKETQKHDQRRFRFPRTKIHKNRYIELSVNSFFLLCLFALIILNVLFCEKRAVKSACSINVKLPNQTTTTTTFTTTTTTATTILAGILSSGGLTYLPIYGVDDTVELFVPSTGITKKCNLMTLPSPRRSHTLNTINKKPVICGGLYTGVYTSCLIFSGGKWEDYSSPMVFGREGHISWVTDNSSLVLMGGDVSFATTDIVPADGGQSAKGFDLKYDAASSCAITDVDSIIITGGRSTSSKLVARYNLQGFQEDMPELKQGRFRHGCGSFRQNDGSLVLVVAGGAEATTETLVVLPGNEWAFSSPLPRSLVGVSSASLNNKVYISGGFPGDRTEILEFDGEGWNPVGGLTKVRNLGAATEVDVNMIDC